MVGDAGFHEDGADIVVAIGQVEVPGIGLGV
ncbi:Protein of unknown function [Lactobacillus delbrueckii subsp. lactis]|nr:Protein of unknown function [Lactobacillus delbrueckii subsp. lactis]